MGKKDTLILNPCILYPVDEITHLIPWEVRNDHKKTFRHTEKAFFILSYLVFFYFLMS